MRALILTGAMVQDHEFIYPYYRLKARGFDVDVATEEGEDCKGYYGTKILVNFSFADVNPNKDYDLLILPGGAKCIEYLRQSKTVLGIIKDFDEKEKIIASICHGSQLLISAKIIKGREILGYYSIKDDIINAGGIWNPAIYIAVDKNIITTSHYRYLGEWMEKVIEVWEKWKIEQKYNRK